MLIPSDYYFCKGLRNPLDGLGLASREETENELVSYFASKPTESNFINKLVDRSKKVLGNNGGYVSTLLQKRKFKRGTEIFLIAIQNNAIRTNYGDH